MSCKICILSNSLYFVYIIVFVTPNRMNDYSNFKCIDEITCWKLRIIKVSGIRCNSKLSKKKKNELNALYKTLLKGMYLKVVCHSYVVYTFVTRKNWVCKMFNMLYFNPFVSLCYGSKFQV